MASTDGKQHPPDGGGHQSWSLDDRGQCIGSNASYQEEPHPRSGSRKDGDNNTSNIQIAVTGDEKSSSSSGRVMTLNEESIITTKFKASASPRDNESSNLEAQPHRVIVRAPTTSDHEHEFEYGKPACPKMDLVGRRKQYSNHANQFEGS